MPERLDQSALCRVWVRSREEDTATERVYRPEDYDFPPSRGRAGLEFKADGTFHRIAIGATDVSSVSPGTWEVVDSADRRIRVDVQGERRDLEVRSLEPDKLVIAEPR